MKLLTSLFILIAMSPCAFAQLRDAEVRALYSRQDYTAIARLYLKQPRSAANLSLQSLIMTANSLDKKQLDLHAARLKMSVITKNYGRQHKDILSKIKRKQDLNSAAYPKPLLNLYWSTFRSLGNYIAKSDNETNRNKVRPNYNNMKIILDSLGYAEDNVYDLNEKVIAHDDHLKKKVYGFKKSVFATRVSWQDTTALTIGTDKYDIRTTNAGFCLGGDFSYTNHFYRFFADGCAVIAAGTFEAKEGLIGLQYRQGNVPANGVMLSAGAGMYVSESLSEIGLKLPILITSQTLTTPPNDDPLCLAGCQVEQPNKIRAAISMYSRWQFDKIYFQTEFGKHIKDDNSIWSLGFGYKF